MAPGDLVQLTGGGQLFPPELADRLQHGEPRAAGGGPGGGQRLVHQRGRRLEGVEPERLRVADGLGRGQRPAAAEHRQPGEEPLLGRGEQVVAPGDGAAQGPLAVREGRAPPVSSVRLRWSRGRICPGVRTLVRVAASSMASGSPSSRAQISATAWAFSSVSSKLGRTAWARSTNSRTASDRPRASGSGGPAGSGRASGGTTSSCSPERERDPGGGQHREPRGGGEQLLDHRAGPPHLLEVVGHEQELPVAEVVAQRVQDGAAGCLGDPQGPGQDGGDQVRVGHRGQVGEEGAVAVAGQQLGRDLECQAGLAGAAGAGEGEQPGPSQQPPGLVGLPLPADERGELGGEVARPGVQGPGREEVGRESLDHQVVQAHREVEVLEAVLAEVAYGGPLGDGVLDQAAGGAGDDHLAAVGRPGDPGRPVDVDADVVVPSQHPLAGVQAHAHPHREPSGQGWAARPAGPPPRPRPPPPGSRRRRRTSRPRC